MAYIYLLNLNKTIDLCLNKTKALILNKKKKPEEIRFLEGRLDVLSEFRQFLTDNLDQKLPKRIRKQLSNPER